jgi:hypothetical protein
MLSLVFAITVAVPPTTPAYIAPPRCEFAPNGEEVAAATTRVGWGAGFAVSGLHMAIGGIASFVMAARSEGEVSYTWPVVLLGVGLVELIGGGAAISSGLNELHYARTYCDNEAPAPPATPEH